MTHNAQIHFSYDVFVRGAFGACSSSDCRYLTQPLMNSGQSGTTGIGSVFSGNRPQSEGWCQQRSCRLLSRCLRIPCRSFFTSSISFSRVILLRSSSITFLPKTFRRNHNLHLTTGLGVRLTSIRRHKWNLERRLDRPYFP